MTAGRLLLRRVTLDQRTFWRNPEGAFFTLLLPIVLLIILGQLDAGNTLRATRQHYDLGLVPGILSFGLIATCYVNLANTLTKQREDGILKRLRATPLSPAIFLAAQLISTVILCVALSTVLVAVGAVAYGARLAFTDLAAFAGAVMLGSACFCALAFCVTIAVSSFAAAAPVTNATYLPLVIISSAFSPNQFYAHSTLQTIAEAFPVGRFAHALQAPYLTPGHPIYGTDWAVLAAWTAGATLLAIRHFRWNPSN